VRFSAITVSEAEQARRSREATLQALADQLEPVPSV
jgi:hypothetical protein